MTEKAHHRVDVIRIQEVRVHPNADKLEIVPIEGYQAVVGKGQYKVGDLAYYIPPDSVVPVRPEFEFLWKGPLEGEVPLKRRRITAKRLRGEWSEGLLMPLTPGMLIDVNGDPKGVDIVGQDVSQQLGITHFDPPEDNPTGGSMTEGVRGRKIPTTFRGWVNFIKMWIRGERREGGPAGLPVYDVDAMKKYMNIFQPGESVIVTEKIHGSNARYSYVKGLFGYGHMYAGSRNLWKSLDSTCAWRRALKDNPWIEVWCKAHPGYALYGEITPTQKGYDYGSPNKVRFFLFDVRDPKGNWMNAWDIAIMSNEDFGKTRNEDDGSYLCNKYFVPQLYNGPFDLEKIKSLVEGPSTVTLPDAKHMREGVVIKAEPNRYERNLGRVQLKIVSNVFLEKETK